MSTPSTGVRATSVRCMSIVAGAAAWVVSPKLLSAMTSGANRSLRSVCFTRGTTRATRGRPAESVRLVARVPERLIGP